MRLIISIFDLVLSSKGKTMNYLLNVCNSNESISKNLVKDIKNSGIIKTKIGIYFKIETMTYEHGGQFKTLLTLEVK